MVSDAEPLVARAGAPREAGGRPGTGVTEVDSESSSGLVVRIGDKVIDGGAIGPPSRLRRSPTGLVSTV